METLGYDFQLIAGGGALGVINTSVNAVGVQKLTPPPLPGLSRMIGMEWCSIPVFVVKMGVHGVYSCVLSKTGGVYIGFQSLLEVLPLGS